MRDLQWFIDRIGQDIIMKGQSSIIKTIKDYQHAKEMYKSQPYFQFSQTHVSDNTCVACES